MWTRHLWLILLICRVGFSQPNAATTQGFMLTGIVVRDGTNQPLNHVLVTITRQAHRSSQAMYLTSTDGRFAFSNLPAGKYELAAMKEGYARQTYLQDEQYSTAIAVGPAIDSEHLVFPIRPPAILSGSVFDDRGDPVARAQVHLLKKSVVGGKLRVTQSGQKQTDSSGGFSFDQLTPGAYLLAVSAQPWYATAFFNQSLAVAGQDSAGVPPSVTYPVTYYPGVTDPGSAAPIDVREGAQAKVQLTLHATPSARVSMPADGQNGRVPGAMIFALGPDGIQIPVNAFMFMGSGQTRWNGVAPGRYVVGLMNFNPSMGDGRPQQMGAKVIDIAGDTMLDTSETIKISVSGKLTLEETQVSGNNVSRQPIRLFLMSENGGPGAQATVTADGSFQFENNFLRLGRYTIRLMNAPELYLKSVTATGAKYSDGSLEISSSGDVQLAITAAGGIQKLEGISLKDGKPFGGAMILLLPKDDNLTSDIRRDQSDSDGTFTLGNVVPGDYILLAIDDGHQLAYRDPAVIKQYLPQGRTITVPAQGQIIANVTARQK
jgi:carboxypeptidase family protein